MKDKKVSTRLNRVTCEIMDCAEDQVTEGIKHLVVEGLRDAEAWIMNKYKVWKNRHNTNPTFEDLQKYIEQCDEMVQIGMDKKEIAVMWAMKKMGYSDEQMQEVLELADSAYLPKGEK